MTINWTPWFDVPLHRRLELFSTGILMFCALIVPVLAPTVIIYLLVKKKI